MNTEAGNCVAFARKTELHPWVQVPLGGQPFYATRGLMETMVEAMKLKHPIAEFKIEEIQ